MSVIDGMIGDNVILEIKCPYSAYCALVHYEAQGTLGANGRFVRSEVTTQSSRPTLEKYAKLSAAGANISAESVEAWRDAARELGVELQETEVSKMKRRLKRRHPDSDDDQ